MSFTTKAAAGIMLAAAASTALTGCGKKSTSTPATSTMPSVSATTTAKHHHSASAMATATSTAKAGYVTGTINGQSKQLKAGELCQSKYASQYTQYGFTCAPKTTGGKYYLTAK